MPERTEIAYAKINLSLQILSRRENGYHELDGIMQNVTLSDRVTVEFIPSGKTEICLRASGNDRMPTDASNLACRAADRFLEAVGQTGKVVIHLEKHIPMAAGLAGGSADAAAVLRALNCLSGNPLSADALCRSGAGLGADVPFCVRGGAMRTQGIGDVLTPCAGLPATVFLVIACAGDGVSTPWAYGQLDERLSGFATPRKTDGSLQKLLHALQIGEICEATEHFTNDFETVVSEVQPYVNPIKQVMQTAGAYRAMMSGSGPSVFGVFPDRQSAETACRLLAESGISSTICRPVTEEFILR